MVYIYDILLNWTDTEKIYEFFEWHPNDSIEHIKKIPLMKVSSKVLSDLKHCVLEVDSTIMEQLKNKSEIFCSKKKELIEYAALFTDGKQVVAIEFDEQGRNLYRSYLLLDEELEVLEIGERLEEKEVTYQIVSHHLIENYLTRSEEAMKRYLVKELKSTYQNKNVNKLQYLYSEYFEEDDRDPKIMYQRLMDSLQATLDEKHHQLYQLLKLSHTKKQV